MNTQEFERISCWYMDHVDKYRAPDGTMHLVMKLKLDHSQRVASDCRAIADELGWSAHDVVTAGTVGLLHDVSRFPQFAQYRTFLDHKSFNHGERGYEMLQEAGILSSLTAGEQTAILNGVRYHNRRDIPPDIDADSLRFLRLIRDADKLDILEIVYDTIKNNRHKDFPEILCHVDPAGPPTPALIAEIKKHGYGSYENVKSMTDMNLMRVIWVYDINYTPSLRRLSDRKLLARLDETLIKNPDVEELLEKANRFVLDNLARQQVIEIGKAPALTVET